jgi:hypothetical protein
VTDPKLEVEFVRDGVPLGILEEKRMLDKILMQ